MLALQGAFGPVDAQSPDNGILAEIFNEPVTSSATGRPQLVSEAPANMEIITQDEIRRSGATTTSDVLAFLPGVYVRRYGINDFDVGIRGYDQPDNPRLLVLVNGRKVFEQAYGHVPWAEIPVQLEEIRQIEVIKGPNSALYGFNAVSGVINIITYDPMIDAVNAATLGGGTQSYLDSSAVVPARSAIPPGSTIRGRHAGEGLRTRPARCRRGRLTRVAADRHVQHRGEGAANPRGRDLHRSERGRQPLRRGGLYRHLRHHVPADKSILGGWER